MPIILRILSYRNEPVTRDISKQFDQFGGTIGRAPDSGLILDDPSRSISRTHARIEFSNGAYVLTDLGSNPSLVNDRPAGSGKRVVLNHGDKLVIGDYQLSVVVTPERGRPDIQPLHMPAESAPAPASATESGEIDPLLGADILKVGSTYADAFSSSNDDPLGINSFSPLAIVPDAAQLAAPQRREVPSRGSESDHVAPQNQAYSFGGDSLFSPSAPSYAPSTTFSPSVPSFSQNSSASIPDDYDPLADLLGPRVTKSASPPASSAIPTRTPPAAAPAPVAESEVIRALLRGLGLPDLKVGLSAPELAELVGTLLRQATEGTMEVLAARAMTKRESRLEMTMLSAQSNNPLKFFPDASGALAQMLGNNAPGYVPAAKAIGDAFDDLKAHELAVMAGMHAALIGVLERFDPNAIERRLKVPTVMDKVLASNRKAKMWDRLVELYGEMTREADDDFQRLFGEKFGVAYEEQVRRLRQARK